MMVTQERTRSSPPGPADLLNSTAPPSCETRPKRPAKRILKLSAMPADLDKPITVNQMADLLKSLKQ
jgi:hypothetical protein